MRRAVGQMRDAPRLKSALVLSVLVHLGLGVWAVGRAGRPLPTPAPRALQLEFEVEAPATRPPRLEPPTPAPALRPRPQSVPTAPSASTAPAVRASERPASSSVAPSAAADMPRVVDLLPAHASAQGLPVAERPRGETLRPDDPRFSQTTLDAQAKARVTERVDGFAEDELATARAQRGLPHPYFTTVGERARAGLGKLAREEGLKPTAERTAFALGERYGDAASRYGATGDPGLGPPGQAPRLSELLNQPEQLGPRALAQAAETIADLSQGKPLLSLTLEVSVTKTQLTTMLHITRGSGDSRFDAFVLRSWLTATADAGPPPPEAFRTATLRSLWAVEGWQRIKPNAALDNFPGVMGVSLAKVAALARGDGYDFHARLLRVY
jgi:hypothetical protein